ncbi:hypothetical protein ABE10_00920 [Bacillus toyonensis]|nr:hypothetical protein [Bacillus toyonensis]
MREGCDARMRGACVRGCDAQCYATQRNETERKSRQDPGEIPSIPDAAGPVDNRGSLRSETSGRLADEWFADFIIRTQRRYRSPARRYDLRQELANFLTPKARQERDYDDKTEQLTRYLRGQNNTDAKD